mmetsp:Transcript_51596/g.102675  ORF Transcript_51596/g.102675 Transcript_51596/m.102675 type:complete len:242 (-) Transcript_51596:809-1534(-)
MHLLCGRPALARLNRHEAQGLEHRRKLMALGLGLDSPPSQARAQIFGLLLVPRRRPLSLVHPESCIRLVRCALVADQRRIAGRTQRRSSQLMEAALTEAAALAPCDLVVCQCDERERRHLACERGELVLDARALCDLVVLRVGDDDLVDGLVDVRRHPLVGLEALAQLLGHLPRVADVARLGEDPAVGEVARQLLLHHSAHAVPRPLAVARAAKVDPDRLEEVELAHLAGPVVHHRARLEV